MAPAPRLRDWRQPAQAGGPSHGLKRIATVAKGSGQSSSEFRFVFPPPIFGISGHLPPDKAAPVTPVVEQDALLKRLPHRCHHDDVVFARRSLIRFRPMQFQSLEL